jgi:hypothetical protein
MNDASDVLEATLTCVHDSYTYRANCHDKSHEDNLSGSRDCGHNNCVAHNIFGAEVFTGLNCYNCGLVSRQLKHTLFLHHIKTDSLQCAMVSCVLLLVYCFLYLMVARIFHSGTLFVAWYRGSVKMTHLIIF